jgi:hypothetical protein
VTPANQAIDTSAKKDCPAAGRGPLRRPPGDDAGAGGLRADRRPRGYGNPDQGRRRLVSSTALEAGPAPDALHASAVRYGPWGTLTATFEREGAGLTVHTEAFTARIGDPADDANGGRN